MFKTNDNLEIVVLKLSLQMGTKRHLKLNLKNLQEPIFLSLGAKTLGLIVGF